MHIDIVAFLTDRSGIKADLVSPQATLDEAGIDSLVVVELAVMLETDYGVVIAEDELSSAPSVAALSALVDERVTSRSVDAASD
ncbi:acyl carrier protein [Streptomyces microflavus]|uniref:acyl carrier protein n=1 Tax=Streptomyces microflavus TaxID=1919 RepID=UPI00343E3FF1